MLSVSGAGCGQAKPEHFRFAIQSRGRLAFGSMRGASACGCHPSQMQVTMIRGNRQVEEAGRRAYNTAG